jgi:hypothetical protein
LVFCVSKSSAAERERLKSLERKERVCGECPTHAHPNGKSGFMNFSPILNCFYLFYTTYYRMLNCMKVTTNIPDQIVEEISAFSGTKTITKTLHIALKEWIELKRMKELNSEVKKRPLKFHDHFSASAVRDLNRKR